MNTPYDQALAAATAIRAAVRETPQIAVVLGSGLGDFAGTLEGVVSMPYGDLPHWPRSGIVGHEGRFAIGAVRGQLVAVLAGRCHGYEGHDLAAVTFAVRSLGLLGVKTIVLTNAAGGISH